jgi:hypothetical protein
MSSNSQLRKIWDEVSLTGWKELLSEAGASKWEIRGNSLRGCCPFPGHNDTSPSCYVSISKKFVKCFGCQAYETNPVKFVATIYSTSWGNSIKLLKDKGVKSFPIRVVQEIQDSEIRSELKGSIASALNSVLIDAILNRNAPEYAFAEPCVKYLESRNIPLDKDLIQWLPIGVLPPVVMLRSKLTYFEKAYEYLKDWLTAEYVGSLAFFYHKTPTEISRFKLRADFLRKDTSVKDIVYIKDEHEDSLGFFGMANYRGKYGNTATSNLEAILVEGEFDCLRHLINFYKAGATYEIVLAVGGSSASSPDLLHDQCGIDKILLATDHPDARGDEIAKSIIKLTKLPVRVFTWPSSVEAKDPDEAIQKHGWDAWLKVLTDMDTSNIRFVCRRYFEVVHTWMVRCTLQALGAYDPDDLPSIREVIAEDGSCIKDPDSQRLYATEIAKNCNLSLATVLELIVGKDGSEEGLVARIIQALKSEFFFIGMDGKATEATIRAWNKGKREPREWRISKSSEMFGLLAIDIGPAITWVREKVGVPPFISRKSKGNGVFVEVPLIDQNVSLRKYLEFAVDTLASELPTVSSLQEAKAGAHYLKANFGGIEEDVWAIVNGHDVYLGRFVGDKLKWSLLDGPRVGKYYFNIIRPSWSREIRSIHDLDQGPKYNLGNTYNKLVELLQKGWSLADGITDCKYLAAAMMVNSISSALPRQLYTLLNGARGSGKSKLLDLIAGTNPQLRLVESTSDVQQAYTSAGFRKDMNNCALGAALDEFEDDKDDSHSYQVRAILRDIRGLTNAPEARITRGNVESAEATVYTLKCQIWACAINYLREEADISRFMQIHTIKEDDKSDPHTVLLDSYEESELTEIRRGITLGLFHHVREFLSIVTALRTHYSDPKNMDTISMKAGVAVPSRFLDGVVITAGMVQLAGMDPHAYIEEVICTKVNLLNIITESTHDKDLIGHILSSKVEFKRPQMESRNTTIRTILSDPTQRGKLMEMDCGVSYAEVANPSSKTNSTFKWLIVMWPDCLRTLLSKSTRYSKETPERLKRMGDSSSSSVAYNTARKKAGGLKQFLLPGISASDITIFDITSMIDDWDNRGKTNG